MKTIIGMLSLMLISTTLLADSRNLRPRLPGEVCDRLMRSNIPAGDQCKVTVINAKFNPYAAGVCYLLSGSSLKHGNECMAGIKDEMFTDVKPESFQECYKTAGSQIEGGLKCLLELK